jgi:hypothetical protein
MSAADRIASGVAKHLFDFRPPTASTRDLIEEAFRRGYELGRSVRLLALPRPASKPDRDRRRVMGRADDHSPRTPLDAAADLCGVDLILECERAASRRNPRHRDPKRWSKSAWRRYVYTAAHAPSLVDLERDLRTIAPNQKPAGQLWTAGFSFGALGVKQGLHRGLIEPGADRDSCFEITCGALRNGEPPPGVWLLCEVGTKAAS